MYLKADKNLDYAKVLDALDIAMKNGVRVVGMISDQKPGTVSTVAGRHQAHDADGSPTGRSEVMAMSLAGGGGGCQQRASTSRR